MKTLPNFHSLFFDPSNSPRYLSLDRSQVCSKHIQLVKEIEKQCFIKSTRYTLEVRARNLLIAQCVWKQVIRYKYQ